MSQKWFEKATVQAAAVAAAGAVLAATVATLISVNLRGQQATEPSASLEIPSSPVEIRVITPPPAEPRSSSSEEVSVKQAPRRVRQAPLVPRERPQTRPVADRSAETASLPERPRPEPTPGQSRANYVMLIRELRKVCAEESTDQMLGAATANLRRNIDGAGGMPVLENEKKRLLTLLHEIDLAGCEGLQTWTSASD